MPYLAPIPLSTHFSFLASKAGTFPARTLPLGDTSPPLVSPVIPRGSVTILPGGHPYPCNYPWVLAARTSNSPAAPLTTLGVRPMSPWALKGPFGDEQIVHTDPKV